MSAYTESDNSSYPQHGPSSSTHQLHSLGQQQQSQQPQHAFQQQSYYNAPLPPTPLEQQQQQQQQHESLYQLNALDAHISGLGQDIRQQTAAATGLGKSASKDGQSKVGRLGRACDLCSMRKVKCDSEDPCKPCKALGLPCTKDRESKRRGPPNKHAEAIKKQKTGHSPANVGSISSPTSPDNVAATLASFSSHAVLNAESILPFPTLKLLVDDFFTHIHPLAPFPHEPSFREAFLKRTDLHSPPFLALLASMIGALVASFPRKPKSHLKAQHLEHMFPSSLNLVERCHKVAVEARGAGYLDQHLTVWDAVTSYFLGLAASYTFQWSQCRLYFGETLAISRVVGAYKTKNDGLSSAGTFAITDGKDVTSYEGEGNPVDHIQQEMARRLFYIMITGIRSLQQIGAAYSELFIPPHTPTDPYPPYPVEVDDEYIYQDHIAPQPPGLISKLAGFNTGIKIYSSLTELATMEMCHGVDQVFDWTKQKKVLEKCLSDINGILASIPPELQLRPSSHLGEFESNHPQYYPPVATYADIASNGSEMIHWSPEFFERRNLQFEIQKANIYASQLATRSYIVEKYFNLQEAFERTRAKSIKDPNLGSPSSTTGLPDRASLSSDYDEIETKVANEREVIVKDFLHVLQSISQVNIEPNGPSFINKIRQVASTLVGQPEVRKGPLALKSDEYLGKFLDVLMRLERSTPARKSDAGDIADEEEQEFRSWADLRDNQMKFAQSGGFSNN